MCKNTRMKICLYCSYFPSSALTFVCLQTSLGGVEMQVKTRAPGTSVGGGAGGRQ
jgi:hypothetical protein